MIVTIVGTGYVGLVTGACLASHGHIVRCVDVSDERVRQIRAGQAPFYEAGLEELLRDGLDSGRLSVTTHLAEAMDSSALTLIAVGTPARGEDPDLSYLETAARQIGEVLRDFPGYHVVAVKSTVVPGTTRSFVRPILEAASGKTLGDFGLAMNPEFLREGTAVEDFQNSDRVVIGQADARSGDVLDQLYRLFRCEKLRVTIEEAELIKYTSNALLGIVISFGNEIASLCEATPGADVENVMEGLYLDRRLSPVSTPGGPRIRPEILAYMRPGIGFGGSCLPKDVNALRVYGKRHNVPTPLFDAVMATNAARPARVVNLAETALGTLADKTVAVLGVAFKPGTDDLRSSPALTILASLRSRGATVRAYDPVVSLKAAERAGLDASYRPTIEQAVRNADAAVITTADPAFRHADWNRLAAVMRSPILIDGRNVLRHTPLPAALQYYPIGRAAPAPLEHAHV